MADLTREDILRTDDLKRVSVPVPEWGGDVWLWELTAAERAGFEDAVAAAADKASSGVGVLVTLLRATVRDADGKPLFTEADRDAMGGKSGAVLMRLADRAMKLNRLTDEDAKELEKNSASGADGDLPSVSASFSATLIPVTSTST